MSKVAGRFILIKRPFKKDILSFCKRKKGKILWIYLLILWILNVMKKYLNELKARCLLTLLGVEYFHLSFIWLSRGCVYSVTRSKNCDIIYISAKIKWHSLSPESFYRAKQNRQRGSKSQNLWLYSLFYLPQYPYQARNDNCQLCWL